MKDSNGRADDEAPAFPDEERLGRSLEEAVGRAHGGRAIEVKALLADRPDFCGGRCS
jgi:hypothetical protein